MRAASVVLPQPVGADDSERRAGGDFQINVAEHRMGTAAIGLGGPVRTGSGKSGRISKGEMTKFDFAARPGAFWNFRVAIIDIRSAVRIVNSSGPMEAAPR